MNKIIAPSILAADFAKLGEELKKVESAGAGWIHLDVMDGHFVPNLTIGPAVAQALRPLTSLPFDAHLMVEHPGRFVEPFAKAGANYLSIHVETEDPARTIGVIGEHGCKPGIVLNPSTGVERAYPFLKDVAYVLIMTVNPGFAGQEMIQECIDKIDALKGYRSKHGLNFLIEVDGGVNLDTIERVKNADIFVAGNGIFKADDYAETIKRMKSIVG